MRIQVRFRGIDPSPELRQYVQRRVQSQLGRFSEELISIEVRIADTNGPKGGLDKRCQFHVRGPRFGSVTIEQTGSEAHAAVDVAVERTARAVVRGIERAPVKCGLADGPTPAPHQKRVETS